jgi:hypothetical protein
MHYNISFSDEAEDEIFSAYIWYEQQRDGLGDEFKQAVKHAALAIQSNPLYYSYRMEEIRGCNTKRFPYLILFFVEENNIYVTSVLHTSRKPNT